MKKLQRIFCAAFALFIFSVFSFPALAAEKAAYKTWEEYEAAHNIETKNWNICADAIDEVIDYAVELYEKGDPEAYEYAKATYWGYYETTGFERNTMAYIAGRVSKVELQFTAFRKAIKNDSGLETVKAEGQKLSDMLHEDARILSPSDGSEPTSSGGGWLVFWGSFGIILREGLEAILIVGAIIAYLIKSGNKKGVIPVYVGAVFAVVCSFAMAFILSYLKNLNSENAMTQEIIEGVAALTAVAVLFYVSNWMVSKSESALWSQYIEGKVASGAQKGSMIALGFTAWLAVFREGAEVILFYQPLMQEANRNMVWLGFIIGCVALVAVFLAIRFLSIKLPIKPFFLATSILMAVMSICFLGAGIKELIEGDIFQATYLPISQDLIDRMLSSDVLDILGIYPLYETIIPQLILLVITVVTFVLQIRKNKRARVAAMADKSSADKINKGAADVTEAADDADDTSGN